MHSKEKKKPEDFLEHLRKPHGILILVFVLGFLGWAIWTFLYAMWA